MFFSIAWPSMTVLLVRNTQSPSVIVVFVLLERYAGLQLGKQPLSSEQFKWARIIAFLIGGKLRD